MDQLKVRKYKTKFTLKTKIQPISPKDHDFGIISFTLSLMFINLSEFIDKICDFEETQNKKSLNSFPALPELTLL